MPEFNGCGYKCYLSRVNARNNCVVNTPAGKNPTASSAGVYIRALYCKNSCGK
jgi:hypothetical protein